MPGRSHAVDNWPPPGDRVVVAGTSGSGKTTFAAALAAALGSRHIELDALHWEAGWTPADPDVFRARVGEALAEPGWVVDGNYLTLLEDRTWGRATAVIWLDLPLPVTVWRVAVRTFRRVARGDELWNGNREQWRQALGRDSVIWWAIKTHRLNRKRFARLFADRRWRHLRRYRLRSSRSAKRWLGTIERRGPR